ncbi:hypothetical protein [Desulfomicrobium apsheronum]|nr:hypothetical protein [Desulfomicrobium apsheronum]
MDLNEHTLTEAQRTLKRLGVTHVLRPRIEAFEETPPAPVPLKATQQPESPTQRPTAQKPSSPASEPLPILLRSLFHGKQSPVRTMWTYLGLYEDMQKATNPPRLVVFKKIQESVCQHLKWQAREISSWPLDLDSETFRKGLEHFRPQLILLFLDRETADEAVHARIQSLLGQAGCTVVTLPSLEEMAQGNQQIKNKAWKILQSI